MNRDRGPISSDIFMCVLHKHDNMFDDNMTLALHYMWPHIIHNVLRLSENYLRFRAGPLPPRPGKRTFHPWYVSASLLYLLPTPEHCDPTPELRMQHRHSTTSLTYSSSEYIAALSTWGNAGAPERLSSECHSRRVSLILPWTSNLRWT